MQTLPPFQKVNKFITVVTILICLNVTVP